MGLKNLKSQFDLVGGQAPVSEMENVNPSQFDLGKTSTLHPDSLVTIPTTSPYQDLDGQPGPQFDLGNTSTLQPDSLGDIPTSSPYQDLDGQPGPQFDLGNTSTLQPDSLGDVPTSSPYQDLDGQPGPQFDFGTTSELHNPRSIFFPSHPGQPVLFNPNYPNSPSTLDLNGEPGPQFDKGPEPGPNLDLIDTLHERSLTQTYNYQHGITPGEAIPSEWSLDGQSGPQFAKYRNKFFNIGPESSQDPNDPIFDTIAERSLVKKMEFANSSGKTGLSLSGKRGPQFSHWKNIAYNIGGEPIHKDIYDPIIDTISEKGLINFNNSIWSLEGKRGPQFAKYRNKEYRPSREPIETPPNWKDTIAERSLLGDYNYEHGSTPAGGAPTVGLARATALALPNHVTPPPFDNGPEPKNLNQIDTLHESSLENIYQSTTNTGFSYGAGQPGGTWPSVQPSPIGYNFADLNGVTLKTYANPDTGVTY